MPPKITPSSETDAARFERAAVRFITECAGQLARESVYQGWLTAFLCDDFGWGRVYREVHVQASDLLAAVPDWPLVQTFRLRDGSTKGALCPDVAISRDPGLDARSSFLRPESVRGAAMTAMLSVVAEVKVAGTNEGAAAKQAAIVRDMAKMGLYAAAAAAVKSRGGTLAAFMIVMDTSAEPRDRPSWLYDRDAVERCLAGLKRDWRNELPAPVLMVGGRRGGSATADAYRDFRFAEPF